MKIVLICLLLFSSIMVHVHAQDSGWDATSSSCQILDRSFDSSYELGLAFVPMSRLSGHGETRIAEFDGSCELGYFRDVLLGDIDVHLDLDGKLFFSSARINLPDQLVALAADSGWTWRYVNGSALQVRIAPGIYSDIEELSLDSFAMPVSAAGVMTFNPQISATVGAQLRLGFERIFMPIIGVVWGPADWLRVEATLPEAKAICHWNDVWSSYVGWAWESTTYTIRDKSNFDRRKMGMEAYRTTVGLSYALSDELRVMGEIGQLSGRTLEFNRRAPGMESEIDIRSATFVRVGIGGPF